MKNKQQYAAIVHAVGRMAAGQAENMGPCSEKQIFNPTIYKDIQKNSIRQSQEENPPDEQQSEGSKQTLVGERSRGYETSVGSLHEQPGAAKKSGKYQASEKAFQKQDTHESKSQEQTAPVDYFLEQSGAGEQPAGTDKVLLERCWYCTKLLPSEELNLSQDNESSRSFVENELSFQQDPRPHFGVAHSSRSTAHPLWSSGGPREMQKDPDEKNKDSFSNCPHCYLRLPLNTLLWHKEKCLSFGSPRKDV